MFISGILCISQQSSFSTKYIYILMFEYIGKPIKIGKFSALQVFLSLCPLLRTLIILVLLISA